MSSSDSWTCPQSPARRNKLPVTFCMVIDFIKELKLLKSCKNKQNTHTHTKKSYTIINELSYSDEDREAHRLPVITHFSQ